MKKVIYKYLFIFIFYVLSLIVTFHYSNRAYEKKLITFFNNNNIEIYKKVNVMSNYVYNNDYFINIKNINTNNKIINHNILKKINLYILFINDIPENYEIVNLTEEKNILKVYVIKKQIDDFQRKFDGFTLIFKKEKNDYILIDDWADQ